MCEYRTRMRTVFNYLPRIPKIFSNRQVLLSVIFLMQISCCCVFIYPWYRNLPRFETHSLPPFERHSPLLLERSAKCIISPMNTSIDPCEDFYGFACGLYAQNVSNTSDPLQTIHDQMLKNISDFLEMDSSSSDPLILHKARTFYRSCVWNLSVADYQTRLKSVLTHSLEQVGLSVTPPLDGVSGNFSHVYTMARAKVIINMNIFMKPVIRRENSTHVKLVLSKPTHPDYPFWIAKPMTAEHHVSAFTTDNITVTTALEEFLSHARVKLTLMYFYANKTLPDLTSSEFNSTFKKLHVVDTFLAYAVNEPIRPDSENNSKVTALRLSPGNTTCDCPTWSGEELNFDWNQYIATLMEDTPGMRVNDDCISIQDTAYIKFVLNWITDVMQPQELELYMWWKTINQLLEAYAVIILEDGPVKKSWCAGVVNDILPHATALMLVNRSDMLQTKMKVGIMAEDIRNVFNSTISNALWMSQTEKNTLSDKLMEMRICIGYPPWLEDSEEVDEFHEKYNEVNLTETDFLVNRLKLVQTGQRMEKLKEGEDLECTFKSLVVNAHYNPDVNELYIQYGYLQLPHYGLVLRALDFGSIGWTIGHELSHGFDYSGMMDVLNDFGDDNNATKEEYSHRMQCFINHYNSYGQLNATKKDWSDEELLRNSSYVTYLKQFRPSTRTSGQLTLNENLADIGGLKIAFDTYKDYSKKYGSEPSSYGLEKYTEDQLYFLAYASGFCSRYSQSSFSGWTDVHCPDRIRVWGALRNSEDFAKAWGCKKGSWMNPNADKCEMW